MLIFDGLRGTLTLVTNADAACDHACEAALTHLDEIEATPITVPAQFGTINLDPSVAECDSGTICYRTTQSEYEAWVEMIRKYILEGEVMQVEPSQRSLPLQRPPLSLYPGLRNLNPSPYMYSLDLGGFEVIGSSPEILVRIEGGLVTVRPITGSHGRGATQEEDQALEAELLVD